MGERAVPGARLEVRDSLVVHGLVVGQDADGLHGQEVGQVPVGPVVVDLGVIVVDEEVVVHGVEHVAQHGDGRVQPLPPRVRAQDLCCVRQLVPVQAAREEPVRVPVDGCQRRAPGVQDLARGRAVRRVAGYFPVDRERVRDRGVVVEVGVVLGIARAPVNGRLRPCAVGGRGVRDDFLPAGVPRRRFRLDFRDDACEVRFSAQEARMYEGGAYGGGKSEEADESWKEHCD